VQHGKAIKHIGRYLFATKNRGIIMRPDKTQGFKIYADADFAGNFNMKEKPDKDLAT
jgi:hypothetical protein